MYVRNLKAAWATNSTYHGQRYEVAIWSQVIVMFTKSTRFGCYLFDTYAIAHAYGRLPFAYGKWLRLSLQGRERERELQVGHGNVSHSVCLSVCVCVCLWWWVLVGVEDIILKYTSDVCDFEVRHSDYGQQHIPKHTAHRAIHIFSYWMNCSV